MKSVFVFISIFTLLVISCQKEKLTQSNYPDMIGEWTSIDENGGWTELSIQEDQGIWHYQRSGFTQDTRGKVKIKPDQDVLSIKLKKFFIDQYPVLVDSSWTMILDGEDYTRPK